MIPTLMPMMMSRGTLARFSLVALALAGVHVSTREVAAQGAPAQEVQAPERAIRRDIPITNAIRRAFAAGTRDSTGRPGRNYWQLRTDYTINARLDSGDVASHRPRDGRGAQRRAPTRCGRSGCGSTRITSSATRRARRPWVPAEDTDGMVITRLAVDGRARASRRRRAGRDARRATPRGRATATASRSMPAQHGWRACAWPRRLPPGARRHARDRVEPQAARRARRGTPHDAALGRHALPADAVVSARRRVRRPARLGHRALPRSVGVLQQLRPVRRAHRRARPAGS